MAGPRAAGARGWTTQSTGRDLTITRKEVRKTHAELARTCSGGVWYGGPALIGWMRRPAMVDGREGAWRHQTSDQLAGMVHEASVVGKLIDKCACDAGKVECV